MVAFVSGDASSGSPIVQDVSIPILTHGMLLVRIHSIASKSPSDFLAGTIAGLGEGVTRFHVGDRVLVVSSTIPNPTNDSIDRSVSPEFAVAEQGSVCRLSDTMEFSEASSLALRLTAINQLSLPTAHREGNSKTTATKTTVLVAGGATPTGILTTQLLAIAGYTPIATCASSDIALCEQSGAVMCFDSTSPACGADVRVHTDGSLLYALDCVGDDGSMRMCYEALASSSYYFGVTGMPDSAVAIKYTRRDVRADWTLADVAGRSGVRVLTAGLDSFEVTSVVETKTGIVHTTTELIAP